MNFIRLYRKSKSEAGFVKQQEMLINMDHVSRIDLDYVLPGNDGWDWLTTPEAANTDASACRVYRIHAGGEHFNLKADTDDAVMQVLDKIYKSAAKA